MSASDPDDKLRDAFARLRHEVGPRVPDAARLVARRPASGRAMRWRFALGAGLGVALMLALVTIRGERRALPGAGDGPLARALVREGYPWRGPTDFLLDLPGAELARTTPTFDVPSAPVSAIEPPHRAERSPR